MKTPAGKEVVNVNGTNDVLTVSENTDIKSNVGDAVDPQDPDVSGDIGDTVLPHVNPKDAVDEDTSHIQYCEIFQKPSKAR